jgi:large subunit ribosomal protein L31
MGRQVTLTFPGKLRICWFTDLSKNKFDPVIEKEEKMKPEIHPAYVETKVTCGCGEVFTTRSTKETGSIYVEGCSVCDPFYTGKQRIRDTGGRVA